MTNLRKAIMNNTIIGIVSDTHENTRLIVRAVKVFKERSPTFVIHCGDIISPPVLERFAGLSLKVVFGNNDGERSGLKKKCAELGFDEIKDELSFEFLGKSFFVYHGTNPAVVTRAVDTQNFDYVLHGHTHVKRNEIVGRTKVINPGALFMAQEYSIAFLNVETSEVEFVTIED